MKLFRKLKQTRLLKRNRIPVDELELMRCKNCDHEFKGHFCPNCGQEVAEFNRPLGFVLYDFAGNFFAFDTRFFQTFWHLISKPGFLTSEFFEGRRIRYSPPFRTFVFLSFILFLLLQFYSESWLDQNANLNIKPKSEQSGIGKGSPVTLQEMLSDSGLVAPLKLQDSLVKAHTNLKLDFSDFNSGNIRDILNKLAVKLEDKLKSESDPEEQKKLNSYIVMCRAPEMVISVLMKYLSWTFFFLLPLFALILKLFYIRRNQYYIRHLIFSIHLHSFLFLILIVIISLKLLFLSGIMWIGGLLIFSFPVYFVLALRKFYGQKMGKTILKFFGISLIYNAVLWAAVLYVFIKSIVIY